MIIGDRTFSNTAGGVPLILAASERSMPGASQTLSMTLQLNNTLDSAALQRLTNNRNLIVVDRQPLFVGKLSLPLVDFDAQQSQGERQLGLWSAQQGVAGRWQLRSDRPSFTLQLPPQGVGEEMEKVKGLKDSNNNPVGPQPNTPIDFRFSPTGSLLLQANDAPAQFVVVPWDLRRILEGVESDNGALLLNAQLELMYGMSLQITQPGLYIAEFQHLQGKLPGEFDPKLSWAALTPQSQAYDNVKHDWGSHYQRLLSRLALLQPWMVSREAQLVLSGTSAIQYFLRSSADLRYPFVGDVPTPGSKAPNQPGGLAGGFSWGFPFKSAYEEVWRNPVSVDAELSRPYFSALGGWGFQKGVFAQGKQTIYADTAMGRTFFYSLERIGRIGVFWNRAKHVIIYERSVAVSEQFDDGIYTKSDQDTLLGRPILRKFLEYVEVLVPKVQYGASDAPSQEKLARSCLLGIEFKTVRINVDSSWGGDVYANVTDPQPVGYQIPLWNRSAAADKPDVYPMPHVVFEFAGDPQASSSFNCEITDPEKLRFFSSTLDKDTADTSSWAAVNEIDFVLQPPPNTLSTGTKFDDYNKSKWTAKPQFTSPPAIEAGFDTFTWHVATTDRKANLTVDRSDKVISALLHNVLVTRPIPNGLAATKLTALQSFDPGTVVSVATTYLGKVAAALSASAPTTPSDYATLKQTLQGFVDGQISDFSKQLNGVAPQWQQLISWPQTVRTNFEQMIGDTATPNTFAYALANISSNLNIARQICLQTLNDAADQLQSLKPLTLVTDDPSGFLAQIQKEWLDRWTKTMADIGAGANVTVLDLTNSARQALADLQNQLPRFCNDALTTIRQELAANPAWLPDGIGAASTAVANAAVQVQQALTNLTDATALNNLKSTVSTLQQSFATGGTATQSLNDLKTHLDDEKKALTTLSNSVTQAGDTALRLLARSGIRRTCLRWRLPQMAWATWATISTL